MCLSARRGASTSTSRASPIRVRANPPIVIALRPGPGPVKASEPDAAVTTRLVVDEEEPVFALEGAAVDVVEPVAPGGDVEAVVVVAAGVVDEVGVVETVVVVVAAAVVVVAGMVEVVVVEAVVLVVGTTSVVVVVVGLTDVPMVCSKA